MCRQTELPKITCSQIFISRQQPTGPRVWMHLVMKRPPLPHKKARRGGVKPNAAPGLPWVRQLFFLFLFPVMIPPPPLPWLCFGTGKGGIQASKPPGTAGLGKHRGILEGVCRLITLPSLISAANLSPRKHTVSMWQWNAGNAVIKFCVTGLCCLVTLLLHFHHKEQQKCLKVQQVLPSTQIEVKHSRLRCKLSNDSGNSNIEL